MKNIGIAVAIVAVALAVTAGYGTAMFWAGKTQENLTRVDAEVEDNGKKIDANRKEIMANRGEIKANREAIKANREEIKANREEIKANREAIGANRELLITIHTMLSKGAAQAQPIKAGWPMKSLALFN